MSNTNYPKVLIISDCDFHYGNDATSITLRNIFSDWPEEKLSFIQLMSDNYTKSSVDKKIILDTTNLKYGYLLRKIKKRQNNSKNNTPSVVLEKNVTRQYKIKHITRTWIAASGNMLNYKIDDSFIKFIQIQQPEIIYVLPYGRRIINLTLNIHQKFNIPILPHFMDDWPSTIYDSLITSIHRKLTLKSLGNLLKVCKKSLVISEAMKSEFEYRYKGTQFIPLMNDVSLYKPKEVDFKHIVENKLSLCYAGGLHLNRWSSLLIICNLMKKLDKIERLDIYTNKMDWESVKSMFEKFPFVHYKGFLIHEEVLESISEYDCLLFIESFDYNVKKYTKFSISTKIPEYLSLGMPIIAIGPSDIASIDYLNKNDLAIVCSENEDECNDIIQKSLSNAEILRRKIENGKRIFFENHYRETQHKKFLKLISSILSN